MRGNEVLQRHGRQRRSVQLLRSGLQRRRSVGPDLFSGRLAVPDRGDARGEVHSTLAVDGRSLHG